MVARLAGARRFALNQTHDINVTPFVDVLLVLLIVMMVVAPLATSAIPIDIPRATPGEPFPRPVVISIANDGRLWVSTATSAGAWMAHPTTIDALPQAVAATRPGRSEIMIRADQHVRYGTFVAALNRLQQAGYYRVGLVSEEVRG